MQEYLTCGGMFRHVHYVPSVFFTAIMKIAAFNIQKFGKNKLSDPEVLNILVKVTHISFQRQYLLCDIRFQK